MTGAALAGCVGEMTSASDAPSFGERDQQVAFKNGGIVQGIAQILGERIVMDESGQVLTGSFMDYHMPRADEYPSFEIETHIVPSPRNPLGIKGAGEAGTVGAVACLASAIHDALAPLGIRSIDLPASSERIWQAVNAA